MRKCPSKYSSPLWNGYDAAHVLRNFPPNFHSFAYFFWKRFVRKAFLAINYFANNALAAANKKAKRRDPQANLELCICVYIPLTALISFSFFISFSSYSCRHVNPPNEWLRAGEGKNREIILCTEFSHMCRLLAAGMGPI